MHHIWRTFQVVLTDSEMDIFWDTTKTVNILDTIKRAYCVIETLQILVSRDGTSLEIKVNSKKH
jgi:hypothetical protein